MMEQDVDLSRLFGGQGEKEDPKHSIDMHDENSNIIDRALHILLEAWSVLRGVYGGLGQFNVGYQPGEEEPDVAVIDARVEISSAVDNVRAAIDGLDKELQKRREADKTEDGKPEDGKKPGDYL